MFPSRTIFTLTRLSNWLLAVLTVNRRLCILLTTVSPYMYTFIWSCGRKSVPIFEEDPPPIHSHHCSWLHTKNKHHHWCSMLSIGACAGLQLHKPCLQRQWRTVCELKGVSTKKFTSTAVLFDVKYRNTKFLFTFTFFSYPLRNISLPN